MNNMMDAEQVGGADGFRSGRRYGRKLTTRGKRAARFDSLRPNVKMNSIVLLQ